MACIDIIECIITANGNMATYWAKDFTYNTTVWKLVGEHYRFITVFDIDETPHSLFKIFLDDDKKLKYSSMYINSESYAYVYKRFIKVICRLADELATLNKDKVANEPEQNENIS